MDDQARALYRDRIENRFLKARGEGFQDLFSDVMEALYPNGDFIRTRPWGRLGDRKNDGYLRSERTLYQVYAPNEMTSAKATAKIKEDFLEAIPHWEDYFDRWVFVHNAQDGLGPEVLQQLLALEVITADRFQLSHRGPSDLIRDCFRLPPEDLQRIFGAIPDRKDIASVGLEEIQPLLLQLERLPAKNIDLRPVPPNKLEFNLLSDDTKLLLSLGERKSNLVGHYYQRCLDPTQRDQQAEGFRARYAELRSANLSPDEIFTELQIYVSGDATLTPQRQVAVYAVLAYFFEACDIFERPDGPL